MYDEMRKLTQRNRTYAEELATITNQKGMADRLMDIATGSTHGKNDDMLHTIQKLEQKIAILENENAAYAVSMSTIKMNIEQEGI